MRRVLVANRGEIAVRIIRACFDEEVESVLACSAADRHSLAARMADRTVVIGPAPAAESYLSVDRIVAAALTSGCDAIHPGYGFLSERPELAEACQEHGLTFVGPPAEVMRRSGDKLRAREIAASLGIRTGGGSAGLHSLDEAVGAAQTLDDYPLLLKASAGGGGRGMTIIRRLDQLVEAFARSSHEAQRAFGDGTLYLERYVEKARHVEVQLLADTHGHVCHLGERDCSTQRRYQKVLEEAPAAGLPAPLIAEIREAAVRLAVELEYVGAGTAEFLVDVERGTFLFLELNARVQVEHPVTEMVTGVDIVREQLRIARGERLSFTQDEIVVSGHSVECRINAENPRRDFLPAPATITNWTPPLGAGVRVDTYAENDAAIPPYYDSMIAKVIVHAADRPAALALMHRALSRMRIDGPATTTPLHLALLGDERFRAGPITTKWLEECFLPDWFEENAS